jgi:ABC-type Fe3+/spermidine/putrescine transport system ATPase subunit
MLTVENLTKLYGRVGQAGGGIRDASFSLQPGAFFTLLGPSGCGKTTTLRCIAGLERPDDGIIRLGDRVVFDMRQRIHVAMNERGIGMVFQSYAIWPHMTVFENVAFPLKARGGGISREEIRRRVEDSLRRVNLDGYGERNATMLSGGEQQRVAFARAIVGVPKLLLLDEPLSNLDAGLREEMRTELLRLQRTIGITTVYVTHDQTEALTLSDRIAVVDRGRILQVGPPTEIYLRPQSEFVARFVGSTNILYGKAAALSALAQEGQSLRVEVGLEQPLACIAPAGIGSNGEAAVSVRPEAIEMAASTALGNTGGDINELRGEVASSTFMGMNLRYDVRVADRMLSVITPPRRLFGVGDKVVLRFPFESAVAVPPEHRP